MYQTTKQFIAAAKVLKEALLLSVIVGKPLRIETGAAGAVPCVPSIPYRTIINNHLSLQAVDPSEPQRAPNRRLAAPFFFMPMQIFCNYDCPTSLMLQVLHEHPWIFMDIRGDKAPAVSEHVFEKMCYSVTLHMPPSAVKELLEFVAENPVFREAEIKALRVEQSRLLHAVELGEAVQTAMRATRPDCEEINAARAAGLKSDFGNGLGPRVSEDLLEIGAAYAAINGRQVITADDLIELFPAVTAHRVCWGEAKPYSGCAADLKKIAEWAIRS